MLAWIAQEGSSPDLSAMALTGGDGGLIQHEHSTKEQRADAASLRASCRQLS